MTDRLDDEIISDLIAQGNIVGIRMKRLKDELERVTAERDEFAKGVNRFAEQKSELMTERDRLRAALAHCKKVITNHSACGQKHIEEIERLEAGRGKE